MKQLFFVCHETPIPQGSMKGFVRYGKVHLTSDNPKLKVYRQLVAGAAVREIRWQDDTYGISAYPDGPVFAKSVPVSVVLDFFLECPIKMPKGRMGHTTKPDVDKLIRAVLDALTGIVWHDDSQVFEVTARKQYGTPRVEVSITSA